MGVDPVSIAAMVSFAAVSAAAAKKQNDAAKRAAASQAEAATTQGNQIAAQNVAQRQNRNDEARILKGRVSAMAAASGSGGDSITRILNIEDINAERDISIIDQNAGARINSIFSTANANIAGIMSNTQSPFLAAASGALKGYSVGQAASGLFSGGGDELAAPYNIDTPTDSRIPMPNDVAIPRYDLPLNPANA